MAQAPAAVFKIPAESHNLAAKQASRKAARRPKTARLAAGKVAINDTPPATRGDGEVIELDLGITVYPPRGKGGRWRAVQVENGERKQCESVSEEKLASNLEKVKEQLAADAPNMTRPGQDLIDWYLNPDRPPAAKRWSRRHADTQERLCRRFARPVIDAVWVSVMTGKTTRTRRVQGWSTGAQVTDLAGTEICPKKIPGDG